MSRGPVVLVVVLVLLVAAVFGWFALRDRISDEGAQAAKACVEGDASLAVTADPDIADAVRTVARAYDATKPVVRDHCITTVVTATPSATVAGVLSDEALSDEALSGAVDTPADDAGEPGPSLWIPARSADAAALVDARRVDGTPRSLASTPVVLGVAPALADTLGAAAVGWADVPRLAASAGSLDAIGAAGWGSLRPALPTGPSTSAALMEIATAVAGTDGQPLTTEQATSPAVVSAISQIALAAAAATPTPPADPAAALDAMVGADDPASAAVHAVPVTEQQLFGRITEGQQLAAFRPSGSTPVADHPAVVLSDTDPTQRAAAADFVEFARGAEQQKVFVAAGFRVPSADGTTQTAPADIAGLTFPVVGLPAPVSAAAAQAAVEGIAASPVRPSTTTVLLDVSGSMESIDAGATRLDNVTSALRSTISAAPDTARVGLWTYSRALDGSRPYRVDEPLAALTAQTRAAIESDLSGLRPATATSTYASVQAAYAAAVQNWTPEGTNTLLLITDGPNDDTSISSAGFLQAVSAAADPARPVRVDVVSLAANSDIETLRTLAAQTGGELTEVSSSDARLSEVLGGAVSGR